MCEQHLATYAGPNGRRYILRPTEHASAYLKLLETNPWIRKLTLYLNQRILQKINQEI